MYYNLFSSKLHVSHNRKGKRKNCLDINSSLFSGSISFGAWINVESDLELKFEQFSAAKYQGKYEKPRPTSPIRGGWY